MPPMAPGTMQAAIREAYGSPDVVEVREIERPVPTGDGVLVRVQAASVNRADLDSILPKPGFLRLILGVRAAAQPAGRDRTSPGSWRPSART